MIALILPDDITVSQLQEIARITGKSIRFSAPKVGKMEEPENGHHSSSITGKHRLRLVRREQSPVQDHMA